jgi:hypothetical protein
MCCPHISQCSPNSADSHSIDVDVIVNKIFQYFHICMVQMEELKELCDFLAIEYKQILGHVKTRWLSLKSTVTRYIGMFRGLKSYFVSRKIARRC